MKKCKYCQSEIDNKAKICPNCRKRVKTSPLTWLVLILFIVVLISVFSGAPTSSSDSNNSNNTSSRDKFSYEVTSSAPDSANFAYYIEGTVKNNRSKDYSYVQIEFVCYDSDGNNLGTAMDNTNNLLGNETWKFKAMALFSGVENIDHCNFKEITSW